MLHASIDTCSLLNLLADESVLPSFLGSGAKGSPEPMTFHVPSHVARETIYILRTSEEDASKLERVEIDLTDFYTSGALAKCDLESKDEMELFVTLAVNLDDGEAACLAIAANRKWLLATDDRLACRLAKELGVSVISTPMIIKQWAARSGATSADLTRVIGAIGRFARFAPHSSSPEYKWWTEAAAG